MDAPWPCQLCDFLADRVTALAEHLTFWHDEWLATRQVPPMRVQDEYLSF